MSRRTAIEGWLPWVLRVVWIGVLLAGGAAIDSATADRSALTGDVVRWSAFAAWAVGVVAMAVPSVISLTAVRLVVPLAPVAAVVAAVGGAGASDASYFGVTALLATAAAGSAELGRVFVQASAYGEEDRHLLRPPPAYLTAVAVTWLVWACLVVASPLLLVEGRWILAGPAAAGAVAGGVLGWPRWHRLSRRWFVVVPVGLVIHDQLVLAETVMLRRQEVAGIRLAPAGTEAADLTGPAAGYAVEISTHEPTTAIFAATPTQPRGTVIHLSACLIAPSRPGRALRAAAARHLPVG